MFPRGRRLVSSSWPGCDPTPLSGNGAVLQDTPGSWSIWHYIPMDQDLALHSHGPAQEHCIPMDQDRSTCSCVQATSQLFDQKCLDMLGDSLIFPGWTGKCPAQGRTVSKAEGKNKPGNWTQILQSQPQIHTRLVIKTRIFSQNFSVKCHGVKKTGVFFFIVVVVFSQLVERSMDLSVEKVVLL